MTDKLEIDVSRRTLEPEPKVQFHLWAVLGFLLILGAICVGFLNAKQDKAEEKQQVIVSRVVTLETQYVNIIKGLDMLTATVEKNNDKLDAYKNEVRNKKTNVSDLKWK